MNSIDRSSSSARLTVRNCPFVTRTRLLGRQERGAGAPQRDRRKLGLSRQEGWVSEQWTVLGLESKLGYVQGYEKGLKKGLERKGDENGQQKEMPCRIRRSPRSASLCLAFSNNLLWYSAHSSSLSVAAELLIRIIRNWVRVRREICITWTYG